MPTCDEDSKTAACRRLARFRQYLAAFLVNLLGFCLGTTLGWTSPMQPLLMSTHPPVGIDAMTISNIAWFGSINYIGSLIGTFFWGTAADRFGRKTTACFVAIPYILSWILILIARSSLWIFLARLIAGIGNSGTTINVPVFISEIAQDDLRGFFGSFLIMFLNVGILFAYIIGTYLKYYGLAICCLIIPIAFVSTFLWLPETPMFLWKNGQTNKAEQSLLWYRGGDVFETEKILNTYKSMTNNQKKKPSCKSLVATTGTTKALIIGITLILSVQGSGIFPILNFAVNIFEMCDTSLTPYQSAIIMGCMQLISSCFCSVLVDRLGRKFLMIGTLLTMSLSLGLLGSYLSLITSQSGGSLWHWIPIICLSFHVIAFSIGVGPVPFIITAEIFPPGIRGFAMAQLQLMSSVIAFVVINFFPTMKELMQLQGIFWFYSSCCLFFAIFLSFYLPETKGKSQNIILKILNKEECTVDERSEETEGLSPFNGQKPKLLPPECHSNVVKDE